MTTFYVAVCDECECVIDAGRYCDTPELPNIVASRHARLKPGHGEYANVAAFDAGHRGESKFANWRPTYADLFGDDDAEEATA